MPRKVREIPEGPAPVRDEEGNLPEDTRVVTIVQEWTRPEQIENAINDVAEAEPDAIPPLDRRLAVEDMKPSLTGAERAEWAQRIADKKKEENIP